MKVAIDEELCRGHAICCAACPEVFELSDSSHHDHLVCLQCGRVEEFYDAEIEKRQGRIAKDRGFHIREHSLYLYADCLKPDCPYRIKPAG